MTLTLGDRDIVQAQVGENVVYKPLDYGSTWIECPQEGVYKQDFAYQTGSSSKLFTIMKWDPVSGKARFKTNTICWLDPAQTKDENHLMLVLPAGFVFSSDNPSTFEVFNWTNGGLNTRTVFDKNRLYLSFHNSYSITRDYYALQQDTGQRVPLESEFTLNVEKES